MARISITVEENIRNALQEKANFKGLSLASYVRMATIEKLRNEETC